MLYVPTYLAPSKIHGIGLFTPALIPKGTCVAEFLTGFDRIIQNSELLQLDPLGFIEHYGYCKGDEWYLCMDNLRFCNHSDTPNLISGPLEQDIAARDIAAHEEFTVNYFDFDEDAARKLGRTQ